MSVLRRQVAIPAAAIVLMLSLAAPVSASHSWGGYHWARTANPFTINLGDNVSGLWDSMLVTASNDWTQSTVLNTAVVAGGTRAKTCRATAGRVEVCSARYGNTGWLGLAQIWISGGQHITQGIVKNNDYYFGNSTYTYNNTAEMQHVICQEIGHTFGLGHQSEDGSSQNSCMDYYNNTSYLDTTSTRPNQHDYDQLAAIYSHLDSSSTVGNAATGAAGAQGAEQSSWGRLIASSNSGREQTFRHDLGGGRSVITFVIWA